MVLLVIYVQNVFNFYIENREIGKISAVTSLEDP